MEVGPTLKILEALVDLGFDDEAFWRLHLNRERPKQEKIAEFRGYCERERK